MCSLSLYFIILSRPLGFCNTDFARPQQRGGYRQHLVQALSEAASGPVPPSALLPILRAKETGPQVTDLALEVLQRATMDGASSNNLGASTTAVLGKRAYTYSLPGGGGVLSAHV